MKLRNASLYPLVYVEVIALAVVATKLLAYGSRRLSEWLIRCAFDAYLAWVSIVRSLLCCAIFCER